MAAFQLFGGKDVAGLYWNFSIPLFSCSECDRVLGFLYAQVPLIQVVFVCQGLS